MQQAKTTERTISNMKVKELISILGKQNQEADVALIDVKNKKLLQIPEQKAKKPVSLDILFAESYHGLVKANTVFIKGK